MPVTATDAATSFATFALPAALQRVLSSQGLTTPTPIQAAAIPPLLAGHDVVGQARTGSGKTLAFGLPLVANCDPAQRGVQALVLVPTRELAIQVGEVLSQLAGARKLHLSLLFGGRSYLPERRALEHSQIIVGTPGRTLDHLNQGTLKLGQLRVFVLDEADEMLDRGFARDVERIMAATPATRQTMLFSATLPEWVAGTAARHLRQPVSVQVDAGESSPSEIEHVVYDMAPETKLDALRSLLDERDGEPVIVFGRTKHGVKKLAARLVQWGYPAAALQGNLSQNARERVLSDFRAGRAPILLATNVAARGLDVQGLDRVINYELPESPEWFTHRVGRTGRMGRTGEAITFLTSEDAPKWREIERALGRRLPRRPWPTSGHPTQPGAAHHAPTQLPAAVHHAPTERPAASAAGTARPAAGSRPTLRQRPEAEQRGEPARTGMGGPAPRVRRRRRRHTAQRPA